MKGNFGKGGGKPDFGGKDAAKGGGKGASKPAPGKGAPGKGGRGGGKGC